MMNINFDEFPAPGSRYSLLDPIGEGAFGRVCAAIDSQASKKTVAIKIQKITEAYTEILKQEYTVLRDVADHSNIANFFGVYKQEDNLWFVLEMCDGCSVIDVVRALYNQNRRMNEEHIAYILKETARGISYLHDRCVIHRDIKAKNIVLTASGEVKIIDFGLSASTAVPLGKTVNCVGSPAWMAPEVINFKKTQEEYDNRIDVWSLGITAIELGDAKAPYQNMHPTRALFQISSNPPPNLYRPSNWSTDYEDFINECLIKNPDHRPYMMELIDHPFLTQIPDNNYHLTLEIKALIEEFNKFNLPKCDDAETALIGDMLKMNLNSDLKNMLVEDLASLDKTTESKIIALLKARYEVENYYSFVGDVLVALNPNENQDIYSEKVEYFLHILKKADKTKKCHNYFTWSSLKAHPHCEKVSNGSNILRFKTTYVSTWCKPN